MTNDIIQVVTEAQSSLTSVNTTVIWIAVIQLVGTVLAAWTTILSRIILKDVNSASSARVAEIQTLNKSLTRLEKRNVLLAERNREGGGEHENGVDDENQTVDKAVGQVVDTAIKQERERLADEDTDSDRRLNQTHEEFVNNVPGQTDKQIHDTTDTTDQVTPASSSARV